MIGKKTNSKKAIPLFKVKEVLSERSKEGELSFEQQSVLDYSKKFTPLTDAKSEKLFSELEEIEGLPEILIVKLVDLVPENEDELNLLLVKGPELSEEQRKKILELLKKYQK